jgi:hypothetical protein
MRARVFASHAMRVQLLLLATTGTFSAGLWLVTDSPLVAVAVAWGWLAALSSAVVCYRIGWDEGHGTNRIMGTWIAYQVSRSHHRCRVD